MLALAVLWFTCCRHLSAEWSYNEQYNYGWFVPFFALYLFWLRWEDRPVPDARDQRSEISDQKSAVRGQSASGGSEIRNPKSKIQNSRAVIATLASIPFLLLLFPLRLIEVANPDWRLLSWVHTLAAVSLTLLLIWYVGGNPWLRHFAFPIVFILVAVPWVSGIEAPLVQGLMPTVASIATETLSLFGIPAEVQGNLIRVSGGVVGVNEACSGVRSLQTSLMIGLLFGESKRLRVMPRILLVIAAIGLAFVANCGRAFFLVWIASTRGVPEVEHWHDTAGYAIVAIVFLGCLAVTKLLANAKSEVESRKAKGEIGDNPQSSSLLPTFYFLFSTFCWLLFIEIGVESWYRAHERDLRPSAQWKVRWPESAPQFREAQIDERTRSILHHDEGRGATWLDSSHDASVANAATSNSICMLYFFRWHPGHNSALLANAHRPDVCLPASGWRQIGDFGVRDYQVTPELAIPFRHFEFSNETSGRTRAAHAFYCVWEDRVSREQSGDAAARGLSEAPSTWSRSERIQAVLNGRRHLGQQVMEYLVIEPREIGASEAEQAFAAKVRELVVPSSPST